jgi:putative hemolysin
LPLSFVLDERGHIEGLVTLTDVDAHEEEPSMVRREDGTWLVDGLLAADELKDRLGLEELPREEEADYQTVGGMVMDVLGRLPTVGDRLEWEGHSFEVLDMDGRRVDKVLAAPPTTENHTSRRLAE